MFLDEIGELPLGMQLQLVWYVLERKEVRRVGGTKTIEVDLRILAATNRDLGVEVNRGRFREDLYFRLACRASTCRCGASARTTSRC